MAQLSILFLNYTEITLFSERHVTTMVSTSATYYDIPVTDQNHCLCVCVCVLLLVFHSCFQRTRVIWGGNKAIPIHHTLIA